MDYCIEEAKRQPKATTAKYLLCLSLILTKAFLVYVVCLDQLAMTQNIISLRCKHLRLGVRGKCC